MKKGKLKFISYVTALAMLITVFNIPLLSYAAGTTAPAAQNGFGVAIGDHIEGGYTQVTTEGIVIEDIYDENLDYGYGPYHPFEITYGDEDAIPEGLITITSSDADVVTVTTYHQPDNEVPVDYNVPKANITVDDEGYTTQYFDLNYAGLGSAIITMTLTYSGGETVAIAEFPVTVKGVSVLIEEDIFVYDGKVKTPKIGVIDWQGNTVSEDNYTVNYAEGRVQPGVYDIEIMFNEDYTGYQGSWITYFLITPKAPSSVTTKLTGYDDIKVSWKKSSGADGYFLYYKKGSGSYTYLKQVTGTYTTVKNLSDGAKYYFKVVPYVDAYGDLVPSTESKTSKYIYTLKKISTPKVKKSGSKVKVSWTNISGETGYQISQSTSKSKTKIVGTYKGSSLKSKNIKATKGKKYYYKVRAYKVVDGKKVYGPWSTAKAYKR